VRGGKRLRFEQVSWRRREARRPRFSLGERVIAVARPDRPIGIIVAAYFDFRAAVESGVILEKWIDLKTTRATPRGGFFYLVLLSGEQVFEGEEELIAADIGSA
jgi:hypothetical protein